MVESKDKIIIFEDKNIRRLWNDEQWFYSVVDVVAVLTESKDAKDYWYRLKKRELENGIELSTNCRQLKLESTDGKKYNTDCANSKSIFRIIQSIPPKKAEPFKQWLAQLGQDRIDEIENPELAQERVKQYYELKGYPKSWVDKRLRGIAIRQELTDEWQNRDAGLAREYAILTNEISKTTFGMSISKYKEHKNLPMKNQNLRDNMTDLELIFSMLGEASTTEITKNKDSQGFDECLDSAKLGGNVAKNARLELEEKSGKKIVSKSNYLELDKKELK
jgi:hypothetical protein